jgi:transcriptional regulator with XRE-family HTH domain
MPRPPSIKKNDLAKAIIALRQELNESQQAFSNRLGVALNTVQRWELNDPPNRRSLKRLVQITWEKARSSERTPRTSDIFQILLGEYKKDMFLDPEMTGAPARRMRTMISRIKEKLLPSVRTARQYARIREEIMPLLDGLYAEIDELDTASIVLPKPSPLPEDIASAFSIPSPLPKGKTK